jgi:phosphoserine phosphatase RsbU/P
MAEGMEWSTRVVDLGPFARLTVYSDGVFEIEKGDGSMWTHQEFVAFAGQLRADGEALGDRLLAHVQQLHGSSVLADDFSILEIQF